MASDTAAWRLTPPLAHPCKIPWSVTILASFSWDNCPAQTKFQVNSLVQEFLRQLTGNLIGVYLHGSLATGCFNPTRSDIDLLVVTRHQLAREVKKSLIETLLRISNSPHPLEISFLRLGDMRPWQYPTPFDLHYSEGWREKYARDLASDHWRYWPTEEQTDNDLAAHVTMTKARGICLWGEPVGQVFPDVPRKDFAASIASDLAWALEGLDKFPVYGVLNACRIYAYFKDGYVYSKAEGAVWALEKMPVEFHPIITVALEAYRSSTREVALPDEQEARQLLGCVSTAIKTMGRLGI